MAKKEPSEQPQMKVSETMPTIGPKERPQIGPRVFIEERGPKLLFVCSETARMGRCDCRYETAVLLKKHKARVHNIGLDLMDTRRLRRPDSEMKLA